VRVIDENGEQMGIMFARDALNLARQRDLDLVEVAPNAVPPVCRLMDYGKFRYEQTKKERDSRKTQHTVVVKEVRLKPNIDEHDLETKIRQAKRFLEEGDKVKLSVEFRGRQLTHTELGRELLNQVQQVLQNDVVIEQPPKMEGKKISMLLAHKPAAAPKAAPRPRRPDADDTPAGPGPAPAPSAPPAVAPAAPAPAPVAAGPAAPPAPRPPAREA
jgi:translation initiation factor IF-3